MTVLWRLLLVVAPLLAALELRAERAGARPQVYVLKPLTTFSILLIALLAPPPYRPGYHLPIVLGLFCSLFGDVFLMLPRDRFLPALFSFLLALVCYSMAFVNVAGWPAAPLAAVVLIAYGLYLLRRLWPRLGAYRIPVIVYAAALLFMCAAAFHQLWQQPAPRTWLALIGALLFVVSDSLLALDRFEAGAPRRQMLVLASYFAAQWLIALSVTREVWWSS